MSESTEPNDDFESAPFSFLPEFVFYRSDGNTPPAKEVATVLSCDVLLPPLICDASLPEAGDSNPNEPDWPPE